MKQCGVIKTSQGNVLRNGKKQRELQLLVREKKQNDMQKLISKLITEQQENGWEYIQYTLIKRTPFSCTARIIFRR